jgi:hypothetical protein
MLLIKVCMELRRGGAQPLRRASVVVHIIHKEGLKWVMAMLFADEALQPWFLPFL